MGRRWLVVLAFVLSVALVLVWRNHSISHCQQRGNCPNLVFIILDDMPWYHFGFLSPSPTLTPSIDKLAARGFVFNNAYNSNSRCRASLATLLTGQYPHQNQIYANHGVLEMRDKKALPLLLEQAGYKTFAGGKFWEGDPSLMNFTATDLDTFHFARQSQDKLDAFIQQYAGKSPLFIWWAPMMPHLPHNAPEPFAKQIPEDAITLPFAMDDNAARDYRHNEKLFRASILWVDAEIGKLMEKLEQTHLRDNTWIVVMADNGWDAARTSKGSPYDIGVRTPLLIIGPHVQQGKTDTLVSTRDVYGSILGLISLTPENNRTADKNVLAFSQNPLVSADKNDSPVFWASYPGYTGKSEPLPRAERDVYALSLRSASWQYTFYIKSYQQSDSNSENAPVVIHSGMQGKPEFMAGDEELFNLATDAYSMRNLASDPQQAAALKKFRNQVFQWWKTSGGKNIDALKDCEKNDSRGDGEPLCKKYLAVSVLLH